MHILFLSHFFPPENAGGAFRIHGLASQLVKRGHKVTVVTGMPNHPQRKIFDEYKGKRFLKEEIDGIKVLRYLYYVPAHDTFLRRIWHYITSMIVSIWGGLFVNKPDVVIATSPQLFTGISGWLVGVFKKCPFVFEIRDIWPETAIILGVLKNPKIIKLSEALESFLYKKANTIVAVTPGFVEYLKKHEAVKDKTKIFLVSNGVDFSKINPLPYNKEFAQKYNLQGKFVVMYTGNLGPAQGLHVLIEAAEKLKDNNDIMFVLVGSGVKRNAYIQMKEDKRLGNVIFIPNQPKSEIPKIISIADCCVVPLIKSDLFKITIPSKLYETMAFQKPVILGVDGDARNIMENGKAGLYFEPENSEELVNCLLKLYHEEVSAKELGENGRNYVQQHYTREKLAEKMEKILKETIEDKT